MNVLIVSLFPLERNTSVANSSVSIIDGLLTLGHQVSIVMPNWPANETACNLDKLRVFRIPGHPNKPYKSWLLTKLHSHFDFLDLTRGYLKYVNDVDLPREFFDVVLSFSDPKTSHIFTEKLLRLKKIQYGRWIQHWGDPLKGDFTRHFWWPVGIVRLYEKKIIKKSNKSVFVTPFTLEMLLKDHIELSHKISFVPLPAEMLPNVEIPKSNELRLSYLGDYNPSIRNLRPLYDACANKCGVKLTIAGHGPKYPDCDNVTILTRVPQQQARQIENESDVLVCVCNNQGTMIPGKIMYKTSTNKHILVAVEDYNYEAMKKYLESFDRYFICKNTVESISSALAEIKSSDRTYSVPAKLLPTNVVQQILQ